jgi:hypothetical protein
MIGAVSGFLELLTGHDVAPGDLPLDVIMEVPGFGVCPVKQGTIVADVESVVDQEIFLFTGDPGLSGCGGFQGFLDHCRISVIYIPHGALLVVHYTHII